MKPELRRELWERYHEVKSGWLFNIWITALSNSVSFISKDNQGRKTEGFYSPDEKISSAMIYRNHIVK